MKELLKSDSICESYAQVKKGPVFLTHSVCMWCVRVSTTMTDGSLKWFTTSQCWCQWMTCCCGGWVLMWRQSECSTMITTAFSMQPTNCRSCRTLRLAVLCGIVIVIHQPLNTTQYAMSFCVNLLSSTMSHSIVMMKLYYFCLSVCKRLFMFLCLCV